MEHNNYNHEQRGFIDLEGNITEVDKTMFELLTLMRDHDIQTHFSCQGGIDDGAYVLMNGKNCLSFLKRVLISYCFRKYSKMSLAFFWSMYRGYRLYELGFYKPNKVNSWYRWERGYSDPNRWAIEFDISRQYGFRACFRWPTGQTDLFEKLLQETYTKSSQK